MVRHQFTCRRLLAVGFVLLLLLPVMQMEWEFVKESPLGGVEQRREPAPVCLTSWLDGSLAADGSHRLASKIGFRSICVRTMNELRIALEISRIRIPDKVTVGKDDWLYDTACVQCFAQPTALMPERRMTDFVMQLASFQALLADQGKFFLLIISPSKAELYAEHLPAQVVERRGRFKGRRNYDVLVEQLREQDVNFIDAPGILRDLKPNSAPLFSRTGTHWNYYACFLIWQEIARTINERSSLSVPVPQLAGIEYDAPRGSDNDLGDLLNVFWLPGGAPRVPYPVVHVEPAPVHERPDFLFVGTSFTWTLVDTLYLAKTGRECDIFYYYTSHFTCRNHEPDLQGGGTAPRHMVDSLQDGTADWQQALFDKEIVVLEIIEPSFHALDWGFCADAIAAMNLNPPDSARDGVRRTSVASRPRRNPER